MDRIEWLEPFIERTHYETIIFGRGSGKMVDNKQQLWRRRGMREKLILCCSRNIFALKTNVCNYVVGWGRVNELRPNEWARACVSESVFFFQFIDRLPLKLLWSEWMRARIYCCLVLSVYSVVFTCVSSQKLCFPPIFCGGGCSPLKWRKLWTQRESAWEWERSEHFARCRDNFCLIYFFIAIFSCITCAPKKNEPIECQFGSICCALCPTIKCIVVCLFYPLGL